MARNFDPLGPVPAEDENGRLTLMETNGNFALAALGAFVLSGLAILSVVFWTLYLFKGGAPQVTNINLRNVGFVGIIAIPMLPLLYLNLIYPPFMVVDDDGISLRQLGRTKRLGWGDMSEIKLTPMRIDKYGDTKTRTTVVGAGIRLNWTPLFGVAPQGLAEYLANRQLHSRSGPPVVITQGTGPAYALRQKIMFYILGGVATIAIVAVVAVTIWSGIVIHSN